MGNRTVRSQFRVEVVFRFLFVCLLFCFLMILQMIIVILISWCGVLVD